MDLSNKKADVYKRQAIARALIQTEPFVPYQLHRKVVLAKNQQFEPMVIR